MSELDKNEGQVDEVKDIPDADGSHPDHDGEYETINDDLEPENVQDEEELAGLDDLDFDSVDVDDVPVLEEGADD